MIINMGEIFCLYLLLNNKISEQLYCISGSCFHNINEYSWLPVTASLYFLKYIASCSYTS